MDSYNTCMTLAGQVTVEDLEALYEAAQEDGAGSDWGELGDFSGFLAEAKADTLVLTESEGNGEFPALEAECMARAIEFDIACDGSYQFDASLRWWRQGMPKPDSCDALNGGEPVVLARVVRKMLESPGTDSSRVLHLKHFLDTNYPRPLGPLVVLDVANPEGG